MSVMDDPVRLARAVGKGTAALGGLLIGASVLGGVWRRMGGRWGRGIVWSRCSGAWRGCMGVMWGVGVGVMRGCWVWGMLVLWNLVQWLRVGGDRGDCLCVVFVLWGD